MSLYAGMVEAALGSAVVYGLATGAVHGVLGAVLAGVLFWFSLLNLLEEAGRS